MFKIEKKQIIAGVLAAMLSVVTAFTGVMHVNAAEVDVDDGWRSIGYYDEVLVNIINSSADSCTVEVSWELPSGAEPYKLRGWNLDKNVGTDYKIDRDATKHTFILGKEMFGEYSFTLSTDMGYRDSSGTVFIGEVNTNTAEAQAALEAQAIAEAQAAAEAQAVADTQAVLEAQAALEAQATAEAQAVAEQQTATNASQGTYTVEAGDNLCKIAQKVYGDMKAWRAIYNANSSVVKSNYIIYKGQVLIIPAR